MEKEQQDVENPAAVVVEAAVAVAAAFVVLVAAVVAIVAGTHRLAVAGIVAVVDS